MLLPGFHQLILDMIISFWLFPFVLLELQIPWITPLEWKIQRSMAADGLIIDDPKHHGSTNDSWPIIQRLIQTSHRSRRSLLSSYSSSSLSQDATRRRNVGVVQHLNEMMLNNGHHHEHNHNHQQRSHHPSTSNTFHQQMNWPNTMKNITATLGRNATFECVFPKLKDFRLVWFHQDHHALLAMHDTVIIKNGRISVRSHANTTFYLTIHEVQEQDRGFYMCQVNTKPMRIQVGYLEVNVPPSFIEEKTSSDVDVEENGSVHLHCQAKGRPEPEITWRREDGRAIVLDYRVNDSFPMVKGHHLNMSNVTRHQMGAYLCIAANGIPPTISKRIFLGVSFSPVIWTYKKMVEAPIGISSITLECHVESYPQAQVHWQKMSNHGKSSTPIIYSDKKYTVFQNDSNVSYRSIARLKINNVQKSDFDKYTCVAKNKMGQERSYLHLLEMERPVTTNNNRQKTQSNQENRKKFNNQLQNSMTTRMPNNKMDDIKKKIDSNDKLINYDDDVDDELDDDDDEMWQYETNYLAPELMQPGSSRPDRPGRNSSPRQCLHFLLLFSFILSTVF